jgi:hypothetical protein
MKLVAQLVHLLVELISQIASEFRQKQSSAREILINLRLQLRYVEMLQFIYSDIWEDLDGMIDLTVRSLVMKRLRREIHAITVIRTKVITVMNAVHQYH